MGGGWAPCDERWENSSLLFPFPRRRLIRQSKQAEGEERAGGLFVKKFLFPHLKKGWGGAAAAPRPPPAPPRPGRAGPGIQTDKNHLHKYALRVHK